MMEIGQDNETIRHLVVSIVEDFWSQLDGPFQREGAKSLSFSVVVSPESDEVGKFRIVRGDRDGRSDFPLSEQ